MKTTQKTLQKRGNLALTLNTSTQIHSANKTSEEGRGAVNPGAANARVITHKKRLRYRSFHKMLTLLSAPQSFLVLKVEISALAQLQHNLEWGGVRICLHFH